MLAPDVKNRDFNAQMKIAVGLGPKVERCKREAAAGNAEAQFTLGLFYEGGKMGLPQDYTESAKWYRKAALQDHAAAQLYFGVYLGQGRGVELDFVEALKWVLLAKRGSSLDRFAANDTQGRLEALMTGEQINLARVRAALFAGEHEKFVMSVQNPEKAVFAKPATFTPASATARRQSAGGKISGSVQLPQEIVAVPSGGPPSGTACSSVEKEIRKPSKKRENLIIIRNSALFAAVTAVGCSVGSGTPVIIGFIIFFPMFIVAYLLGFPWMKKK